MYHTHKLLAMLVITISLAATSAASTAIASGPSLSTPANSIPLNIPRLGNTRPSYYPLTFQAMGKLHGLSSQGQLRIHGSSKSYTLSPNVLIHSLSTQFSSRHELRPGTEIGFSFAPSTNTITEIWLLPDGALAEH